MYYGESSMRLGLNSNLYLYYPIDEVIKRIYVMGYEGVEIARTHLCNKYREFNEDYINVVKNVARQYGIVIYGIQGSWGPFTDPNFTKSRIDLARKLDCPLINLGAGLPVGPKDNHAEVFERTLNLLEELHDYARSYGIETAIEPEVRPALSPEEPAISKYRYYDTVLARIPKMGLVLDVEHAIVNNENPYYIIRKYKNQLKVIHVSDSIGNLHLHLMPGAGDIDFVLLLKTLKEVGYDRFISMEIYPYRETPDEAALASIMYIQKILNELK